jgi:hypothetical protein
MSSPVSTSELESALGTTDLPDQKLYVRTKADSDTRGAAKESAAPVVLVLGLILILAGLLALYYPDIKGFGTNFAAKDMETRVKHCGRLLIVLGGIGAFLAIISQSQRPRHSEWKCELDFKMLNDKFAKDECALDDLIFATDVGLPPDIAKIAKKKREELQKAKDAKTKEDTTQLHARVKTDVEEATDVLGLNHAQNAIRPLVYVIDMNVDMEASQVDVIRHMVSLLVRVCTPGIDEVVLILDNSGGTVHGHGLCASQLWRLRQAKIPLTVIVDKVGA